MPRKTFSKTERAFIAAHKHDAEEALRLLIADINTARREVASYALAFSSVADFVDEALAATDPEDQRRRLTGVVEVCRNFAVPARAFYESIFAIENFDAEEHEAKKAGKSHFRRVLGDV